MQVLPDVQWLGDMLNQAAYLLPSFSPSCLSCLIWALARMRVKPPKEWMNAVLEAAQPELG